MQVNNVGMKNWLNSQIFKMASSNESVLHLLYEAQQFHAG